MLLQLTAPAVPHAASADLLAPCAGKCMLRLDKPPHHRLTSKQTNALQALLCYAGVEARWLYLPTGSRREFLLTNGVSTVH